MGQTYASRKAEQMEGSNGTKEYHSLTGLGGGAGEIVDQAEPNADITEESSPESWSLDVGDSSAGN